MATATSPLFVGRGEELGRLLGLLERAERGRPAVGLVAGDAGVGKTRLLAELADRAQAHGARVLIGGCMEAGDVGLPYVPFVDALRDLGARPGEAELATPLVDAVPSLGLLLPEAGRDRAGAHAADGFERVQLFDGMRSLLVRLSELAPLLLIVEDLHWADRSTRDLLAFLVRALRTGRVAVIASYRSDELHRRHPLRPFLAELVRVPELERIDLAPFGRDELAEHLEAITGERVPPAAVDRVLDRSEGNAFFAEELVAAGAVRAEVALPETLADVLLRRVEGLSELAQEILKLAAVAGRRVGHRLLAAAAVGRPEAELESGLREAIAARVLVLDPATETYRFRHALLQEVVYGELLPGERVRLHATYAKLLEGDGPAAELAWHCLASHDLPGSLRALVRAAADATAVAAPAEAYRHLVEAVDLWERVPDAAAAAGMDHADLFLLTAEAASMAGRFRRAVAMARMAVAAIDDGAEPLRAAVAYERLAHYLLDLYADIDEGAELLAICRRAVELVPADPPTALRARVAAGFARVLLNLNHFDEARHWCDEAVTVARAAGSADDEINALVTLAALRKWTGDLDSARTLLRDARARAAAAGIRFVELRAQHNLGTLELDDGNLVAACEALDEGARLAERTGLAWSGFGWDTRILRCLAWYMVGDWDQAELHAERVEEHDVRSHPSPAPLFIEVGRGRARADTRIRALAAVRDDPWVLFIGGTCAADHARWRGDLDAAREAIGRVLAALPPEEDSLLLNVLWPVAIGVAVEADRAERARAADDRASAAEAVDAAHAMRERGRAALAKAREQGRQIGPEALAWQARADAESARVEGTPDPERWRASAEAFGYGYVYEQARSRWRLAEALLAAGRRDQAGAEARAAHAVSVKLGAEPLRGEVEALARRGRLDLGVGAPEGDGTAGLTPRELEVVRLVAAGRSNSQIAEALFISPKTASVHVSNILAKFGVHTRTEAAATAHRLGLDAPAVGPSADGG
jgi:DNA-binding CsgD family transcriptional regulator